MLELIKCAFYGIVQGLTEFLPVSSSGHLAILKNIFGLEFDDAILFTLILHLGSLAAVFIVYFKDIKNMFFGFFALMGKVFKGKFKYKTAPSGERLVLLLLVATIPLVPGAILDKQIEVLSGYTKIIGVFLLINSVILFFSDMITAGDVNEKTALPKNALFVGLCQLIAVVPGISRSGSTITGGLLNNFNRQFAVKFSFIMSIPAILGASVFKFADFAKSSPDVTGFAVASCLIGFVFAFFAALAAIVLINIIVRKKNFMVFSVYCFAAGLLALIFG
ncbi:MAG: undecaprenyl-diphosphate phosphatase [Oscillospiraceae bacterium]|nr:undecaprenyl-diphosphate phosphatase [Oscillospiraceae bacterium]